MLNKNIVIENARIGFRNFSGKEGKYNPAGRRNFCVFLDPKIAEDLVADGWNVRYLEPRDPDDEKQAYLQVAVNFSNVPPKIIVITSKNKTTLEETTVNMLDWAEIENVDLIIRPYNWDVNGKSGVKAYIKSMYVTLVEDEFEKKYRDVPDAAISSLEDED
jgi:hypothetical protein